MKHLLLLSFALVATFVSAQTSTRLEIAGYGAVVDKSYVVDGLWSLEHMTEDATVMIYDGEVVYIVIAMIGVVTITATCASTTEAGHPIFLTLPMKIGQGTRVRVRCGPSASVLFSRSS